MANRTFKLVISESEAKEVMAEHYLPEKVRIKMYKQITNQIPLKFTSMIKIKKDMEIVWTAINEKGFKDTVIALYAAAQPMFTDAVRQENDAVKSKTQIANTVQKQVEALVNAVITEKGITTIRASGSQGALEPYNGRTGYANAIYPHDTLPHAYSYLNDHAISTIRAEVLFG